LRSATASQAGISWETLELLRAGERARLACLLAVVLASTLGLLSLLAYRY
jgi:hypothetical protein